MITKLHISHLRNLSDVSLSLGSCNVFVGDNGSGKTSLLESIFLLSRGKSFRHFETKRYINHTANACTVWATVAQDDDESTFAIAKYKDDTKTKLRHNQTPLASQAILTKQFPTLLIDPSTMEILEDGTANRRQLLDWLCFHSVPTFHHDWLDYQRLLKQRNALLKNAGQLPPHSHAFEQLCQQIGAWDSQLSIYAHKLHATRQAVFDEWLVQFNEQLTALLPEYANQIVFRYQAGFDDDNTLSTILADRLIADIELGYTRIGAHRADLSIALHTPLANGKTHKEQAVNVLSRGEKKLLITALKLSGLPQVCQANPNATPLVLIDDLDSELDGNARRLLLGSLAKLPCQLFMSSLSPTLLDELNEIFAEYPHKKPLAFALKDGTITPITPPLLDNL